MVVGRWTQARAIVMATLIAGTLDIVAAFALNGFRAEHVLQTIASAVMAKAAFDHGWASAALGLALHYAIMLAMVALFMIELAPRRPIARKPYQSGALYGLLLWALMYLIVLPLRWPAIFPRFSIGETSAQLFCHIVLVGLTMGWATTRLRR
jgi:hypothetical protein